MVAAAAAAAPSCRDPAERETGFEPATSTLARWSSTPELFPRFYSPWSLAAALRTRGTTTAAEVACERRDSQPHAETAPDPKSGVSANSTTLAHIVTVPMPVNNGEPSR